MESYVKNSICWLFLFFSTLYSNFTLAFIATEIEQKFNQQIQISPQEVFYKIEALLEDPEMSLAQKARLMVIQSETSYFIDRPEYILKYSKLALSSGLLDDFWYTRAIIDQARGYSQRGQYKEFFATANIAVTKAERSSLSNHLIAALIERAYSNIVLGNEDKGIIDLKLAVKYLDLLPDVFEKAVMLGRYSAANKEIGRIETAKKYQLQAINIYKKIESPHFLSIGYYNLGRIYQEVEDWEEASKLMLQSYRWALKDKNKLNQAFSLSRLSEFQNKLGKYKQAKEYLNEAVIAADASISERVKIQVRTNMAAILCQNNEFEECKTLLIQSISFAKSYKMRLDQVILMRMLAEAYYQLASFEKAYLTLKEANQLIDIK